MKRDKIDSEIKELNAIRAMHKRDFHEIKQRYCRKEITDKTFEKLKRKYGSRFEKIKKKIRKLEEKINMNEREKRFLEWSQ